ncbi:efflux RND transporter periplasmic adaptor subunit [Dissulfurimicrobium hydrothermale]|uniref:efflux RND transporter periplasmic adaptor subunit n=1 Tax=Dissulfurimicrobium hydrothermale TaxID=1750598 RepID=UPI001EDB73D3|nr:hypothetical protein [Dissulfurimicrobium hydrothermale]UKL13242.1 hypothetical protein LGS26_07070 [Dissulfurimicrobium hydrothermale]
MNPNRKLLSFVIVVLMGISAFLIWIYPTAYKPLAKRRQHERPVNAPSCISIENGKVTVAVDAASRIKSGIVVAPLKVDSRHEELKAYGRVIEVSGLANLYNSYVAQKAMMKKTEAHFNASYREYERLRALHKNGNISDKALESAETAWLSNKADVEAANGTLHIIETIIAQQWGPVIAKWIVEDSPSFNHLLQQQDLLVQITSFDKHLEHAPGTALIQASDGNLLPASLVSSAPHANPLTQRAGFFYIIPARAGLFPGMNITAWLPIGPKRQGVIVPDSAVVWWQGRAWVYVQNDDTHFVRREIVVDTPVPNGWFVANGWHGGERVVVKGAALLFSEEFQPKPQPGNPGGGDDDD